MDKFSALKYYYGYDTFKEGQAEVMDQLLCRAGRPLHHAHGSWEVSVLSDPCTAAKRYDHRSIASDFADEGSGEHVAANGYFCCLYQQFPFFTGIP